ncbi:MAG TPA: response regulator [Candidatus Kapabacteria bacterium]|nr:response regulator [Candidatus Kapabacteria bacterium]
MKKIFVADQDEKFQTVMKSICQKGDMDLHIYTSSMEILPLIEQENPDLVFLNLELPDIDDFVMFDLLKKADTTPPIPVLITYMAQSENVLQNYKNLKFQPRGYHKKPIKEKEIQALLSMYLGDVSLDREEYENKKENTAPTKESVPLVEEDDIIFSEVLAENEIEENPIEALIAEPPQRKPIDAVFKVSNGNYVDVEERTAERERAARLVSLEKQNHFLLTENKRLSDEVKTLKEKSIQTEFTKKIEEEKGKYEYLEKQIDELNIKLTDKERELIAKDHEFEKKLRKEVDEMIRETEERLRAEISQYYNNELNIQKETNAKLEYEITALKEIETSSNADIAKLDEEKTALSQKLNELENEKKSIMKKLMALEVDLANLEKETETLQKEKEEREKSLSSAVEKLKRELELNQEALKDYQNRIDMLGDLLQKAITLTKR